MRDPDILSVVVKRIADPVVKGRVGAMILILGGKSLRGAHIRRNIC